MTLALFGRTTSINVRKVLWTGLELGLDFDHEETDGSALQGPEFLALNPNGLIPVLRDGELVLWESNAICRYLAGREQRHDLLPTAPAERAVVDQWMDWQATELNNAWRYAFLSLVRKRPDHQDPAAVAASVAAWNRHMTILDRRLAATARYVAGPALTLADIVLGLAAHRWARTPIEHAPLPAVDAWMARLAEHDGFRRYATAAIP